MKEDSTLQKLLSSVCHCCAGMGCETHDNRPAAAQSIKNYCQEQVIAELEKILFQAREHTITDIEMIQHHTQGKVDFIEAVETAHIIDRIKSLRGEDV